MTTGGSMPHSQSAAVRCKLEDVKLISGSIQWLTRSQCDVWHFMSLARRSTEGILDVVSEQTKHTGIPFLCYEEIRICPFVLEFSTPSVFLCFNTGISNLTRSTEKNGRKTYSYLPVSSKSARSRHYYLAKSARSRHYPIASDQKWNERSPDNYMDC